MKNKTKVAASQEAKVGQISRAIREIVISVNTLKNAGRYPRRGWRYEVTDMMNDAKLVNSVENLNAIKEVYCSWCKKCNHGLCMDRAPISCRLARTYEQKLGVLQDCEYGSKNGGKAVIGKKRKEYEIDNLHTLFRNAATWFTQNQDVIDNADENNTVFILSCKNAFERRDFGVLKEILAKYGYYKRGRKKVNEFSKIAETLCKIIKEVF